MAVDRKRSPEYVTKKKIKFMTILEFQEKTGCTISPVGIGYHMTNNQIDWMQPARDRFILVTDHNREFYEKADPIFFNPEGFK